MLLLKLLIQMMSVQLQLGILFQQLGLIGMTLEMPVVLLEIMLLQLVQLTGADGYAGSSSFAAGSADDGIVARYTACSWFK